jgi:hypothetical protein
MSIEGQPNTILTVYSPFAWIEEPTTTSTVSGSFINFPTAQNALITFPNTIDANTIKTNTLEGSMLSYVNVNSDMDIGTGYALYTNTIDKSTGSTLNIGESSPATINIGTNATRTDQINIGTDMTVTATINLGGANGTTNAQKLESGFISCAGNSPLSIGTFAGRTRDISIGTGMNAGNVLIGGALTNTKLTNLISDTTLNIQQSDNVANGAVEIGCGDRRTGDIDIGVNTTQSTGQSSGSVNIMTGIGHQSGSFNVLTNSNNRGVINLGSTGTFEGGINIFAEFLTGIKIGWSSGTYSGTDRHLGSYKKETYENISSMSLNTTEQRIVGSTPAFLGAGVYQFNVMTSLRSSILNPYLIYGVYTKTTSPAWVNGNLRGTSGTANDELTRINRNPTTALTDVYTISLSGILVLTSRAYIAIVIGNGDVSVSQNITYTNTYMSFMRMG